MCTFPFAMSSLNSHHLRALSAIAATLLLSGCNTLMGVGADDSTAKLLWNTGVQVSGAPGVDANYVYAMDLQQHLIKFDRANGRVIFSTTVANAGDPWDINVVRGTVVAAAGPLIGLDTATAAVRWVLANDTYGLLPATSDDSLWYPSKRKGLGEISAVDPRDGTKRWTSSVLPPDSLVTTSDDVRVFGPNLSGGSLAASFVVWKGTSQINRGGVALLDARTGVRRWSHMLPVKNPAVNTIPDRAAIGNGAVVASSAEGYLYCYDEQTGALRWTGATAYEVSGNPGDFGDSRPVAISGQVVVAGSVSLGLTGYDIQTGRVLWTRNPSGTGAVFRLINAPGGRVLARHLTGGLSLLDAANGTVRWVRTASNENDRVNDVRIAGDTLFGTSIVGGMRAWKLPN